MHFYNIPKFFFKKLILKIFSSFNNVWFIFKGSNNKLIFAFVKFIEYKILFERLNVSIKESNLSLPLLVLTYEIKGLLYFLYLLKAQNKYIH